ncbi:DNA polymerase epsilon subunit 4 [Malaya genurostris]|uniref:DNA polymerase epsilon subunit 4 n=1 Tax=Malaya genurostris TaxID=325434 RepID=UPI0026F3C437|nr:DNA polymerase epsilon subunit 4 [Malaya genurostris]
MTQMKTRKKNYITMEQELSEQSQNTANNRSGTIDSEEVYFGSEPLPQENETHQAEITEERAEIEDIDEIENLISACEDSVDQEKLQTAATTKLANEPRLVNLPLSKVKQLMKFDPDVHIISAEAIFLVTRAAELFAQTLAKESHAQTAARKKKTIVRSDVDATIESVDSLMFLEGMMNA